MCADSTLSPGVVSAQAGLLAGQENPEQERTLETPVPDLVVAGLGYASLPLAAGACRSGVHVAGFDADPAAAARLNSGAQPVERTSAAAGEFACADLVILLRDHIAFDLDAVTLNSRLLLDTRGVAGGEAL